MKHVQLNTMIYLLLLLGLSQLAPAENSFEVDLDKVAKAHQPLVLSDLSEKQVQKKSALTRMKWHESKAQWKECRDLRASALKAQPQLAGWIWTLALNCELKSFEPLTGQEKPKEKTAKTKSNAKVAATAKAFENYALLDRGPWRKNLQQAWLKLHLTLREQSKEVSERQRWARALYSRPELLSSEIEAEILRELQKPFSATRGTQVSSQRPVALITEPWWEPARKMDYEQVVQMLEEYLKKNSAPSNALSAQLLLARAYLWTGRYEMAKVVFQKVQDEAPLTEEGIEAAFRLGLLHLRLANPQLAIQTFDKLLATGREKNPLTTRYWRLRALELAGQTEAFEIERSLIINQYPFTYFGLKLRVEAQKGRLEFPELSLPERRTKWTWPKSVEVPWKRTLDLIKAGLLWEASQELQDIISLADAESYSMWAEFAAQMKLDNLAIRFAQQAQNLDERMLAWSFQRKYMPLTYEKVVLEQSEIHKVEPWMIWAIIRQESAFNPRAVSTSNAFGLMQLIGPTAQEVAQDLKTSVVVPDELFVPDRNIPFGTRYLAKMKNEFGGHWPLAVAAYNAGPTRLKAWLKLRKDTQELSTSKSTEWRDELWIDELPWNETQNYVKSVMRNFILYRLGSQSQWTLPPVFWSESTPSGATSSRRLIEKRSIRR